MKPIRATLYAECLIELWGSDFFDNVSYPSFDASRAVQYVERCALETSIILTHIEELEGWLKIKATA